MQHILKEHEVFIRFSQHRDTACLIIEWLALLIFAAFFLSVRCTNHDVQSRMPLPNYKTSLLFKESFNQDLKNWSFEGKGSIVIGEDGRLRVTEASGSDGVMIWITQDFSDDFQLEYEVEIPETPGMNIVFVCAQGTEGEDILTDLPPRTGNLQDYTRNRIRSYHISYHCYSKEGEHNSESKIRKNPGHMQLAQAQNDPCQENRLYYIDVIKTGNRIRFYVDGKLIHDVRDKGGFGPAAMKGKIGFWSHGLENRYTTIFDNIRIFKLIPT